MTTSTRLLCCVTLAASLGAQVQITGETLSTVGVYAERSTSLTNTKTLPKGTKFTSALKLTARAGDCWAELDASIAGDKAVLRLHGKVGRSTVSLGHALGFSNPSNRQGSPRLGLTFRASKPTSGSIRVKMTPLAYSTFAGPAYAGTKIKGGGTTFGTNSLWRVPLTKSIGVDLDSKGTMVEVELTGNVHASDDHPFEMRVEISFVPGHKVTNYSKSYGHLGATFPQPGTMQLDVSATLRKTNAFLLVGTRRVDILLDFLSGTRLLVDPLVVLPLPGQTNSWGQLTAKLNVPQGDHAALLQVAVPSARELQLTDGLDVVLVKR